MHFIPSSTTLVVVAPLWPALKNMSLFYGTFVLNTLNYELYPNQPFFSMITLGITYKLCSCSDIDIT